MASQEFTKFTIESKKDPASKGYNIADYDKDLNTFIRALKSALPKDTFFSVGEKELGKQGKLTVDIFTHKEDANLVNKALNERVREMLYKGGTGGNYEKYNVTKRRSISDTEQEAVQKEENTKLAEEMKKSSEKSLRHTLGAFAKVTGAITVLTDVTRRILSAVLTYATQTLETGREARNLGSSFAEAREARLLETAHNLPQGTITGAMADIQQMFGNITSLDENALESLALVMGSSIKDMVMSGMGGERPNELLGKILDSYMARANAGYNSVGEYVGEVDARRELYSQLLKISPQLATLFATMVDERNNINSVYREQFDTFEEWKRLLVNRGGVTSTADYGVLETMAQYKSAISAMIVQLKEGIEVKVAPLLLEALQRISQWRVGLTEDQKRELDVTNRKANQKYLERVQHALTAFPDTGANPLDPNLSQEERVNLAYRQVLLSEQARVEDELKKSKDIDNLTRTEEQIRNKAQDTAVLQYKNALSQDRTQGGGSLPNTRPYGSDVMWELINLYIPEEEVNKVRAQYAEELERSKNIKIDDAIKDEQKQKDIKFKEVYDKYRAKKRKGGLNLGHQDAILKIAKDYPSLVSVQYDEKGKLASYTTKLTEEEIKAVENSIVAEDIDMDELADRVFDKLGKKYDIIFTAEKTGMERLEQATADSKAYASTFLPQQLSAKGAEVVKGTYDTIAYARDGTYTIVLDINKNGKADSEDIVLTSMQGGVFAEGNLGIQYDVADGKITKKSMQSTPASAGARSR